MFTMLESLWSDETHRANQANHGDGLRLYPTRQETRLVSKFGDEDGPAGPKTQRN